MLPPERIAELRRECDSLDEMRREHGNYSTGIVVGPSELRALLAECERVSQIAELLQAGTMRSHGFMRGGEFSVIFETVKEARALHDLLEALTHQPEPKP